MRLESRVVERRGFVSPSVVSSTDLYTETGDAPGQPGAKSEHIGHIRAMSNAVGRDAASVECIDLLNSPH